MYIYISVCVSLCVRACMCVMDSPVEPDPTILSVRVFP